MAIDPRALGGLQGRKSILYRLRSLLLDPRRDLSGFSFGISHRDPTQTVLSVLVRAKREREEMGPFDVFFPQGGFEDAGRALGIEELEGVALETRVEAVGDLQSHQTLAQPQYYGTYGELRSRTRPAFSGASIGHERARGVGTIGALLRDRTTGKAYALSNNHVLALGTGSRYGLAVPSGGAQAGDTVLQPGLEPLRLSQAGDRFGTLADYLPLRYLGQAQGDPDADINLTDAGLVEVPLPATNLSAEVPYLGPNGRPGVPTGVIRSLATGDMVKKVGRTTGLTYGRIIHGEALVRLDYPEGLVVLDNQVITTHMSSPGDSGSLILTADTNEAAGILVGGSEFITIFTPLPRVLRLFREKSGLDLELLETGTASPP